jgi:hypothetical protein
VPFDEIILGSKTTDTPAVPPVDSKKRCSAPHRIKKQSKELSKLHLFRLPSSSIEPAILIETETPKNSWDTPQTSDSIFAQKTGLMGKVPPYPYKDRDTLSPEPQIIKRSNKVKFSVSPENILPTLQSKTNVPSLSPSTKPSKIVKLMISPETTTPETTLPNTYSRKGNKRARTS